MPEIQVIIRCCGHPNVSGRHPTTFEITRDRHLSTQGDCIIGIAAESGASDLPPDFAELLARDDALLITRLLCRGHCVTVTSRGCCDMTLDNPTDLVWRKSSYVCGRTVGIRSDIAARDLPRGLITALQDGAELIVEMTVRVPATPSAGRSESQEYFPGSKQALGKFLVPGSFRVNRARASRS